MLIIIFMRISITYTGVWRMEILCMCLYANHSIRFDVTFCVHYQFNDALKLIASLISFQMIEDEEEKKQQ